MGRVHPRVIDLLDTLIMTTATIICLADHRAAVSPTDPRRFAAMGAVVPFALRTRAISANPYQRLEEAHGAHLKALAAHDVADVKERAAIARNAPQAERDALRMITRKTRIASMVAGALACGARMEADSEVLFTFTGSRRTGKRTRRSI